LAGVLHETRSLDVATGKHGPARADSGSGSSYTRSLLPSNCHCCQLTSKIAGPLVTVLPPWWISSH